MSILVVGSVAYDSVKTAMGSRNDALGGSATYFSISGSYFASVSVVAVVGDDFQEQHVDLLKAHQVDLSGLQRVQGRTFRWAGEYSEEDVNIRETLDTQLNVFAEFQPELTGDQRRKPFLFLGNIDPELQLRVLGQMEERPRLVAADTMNFWIEGKRDAVTEMLRAVDVLLVNEDEARLLAAPHTGSPNLVKAAAYILGLGPRSVLIKRGEHGVIQFTEDGMFVAPAFPVENVADPTGAGDSFAGGFMGYLAAAGDVGPASLRRATVLGSVMGSFAVESFSVERLGALSRDEVTGRFREFSRLTQFDGLDAGETLPWRGDGAGS